MVFSSIPFLYFFLPLAIAAYFAVPKKAKNAVLLLLSLAFYFYGEQLYILVMAGDIAIAYIFGLLIERRRGGMAARTLTSAAIIIELGTLFVFKYSDFFIESVNAALKTSLGTLGLALPLGISFYTFQTISYIADVYRGDVTAQKNIVSLATYIALFPQLVAGPIVRYATVKRELCAREHSLEKFADGAFGFAVGLAKKVILADRLFELCDAVTLSNDKSVVFWWIYAAAFSMYVYFDFSGYSDMAIGLGRMFGFTFDENFNYPFISRSVSEFWRRWHISLGTWFRDYVYIPLGGNRKGILRTIFNILAVWALTGLWHGASWNFLLWGIYFGVLIAAEKLFLGKILKRAPSALSHIYLILTVTVGFVIFGADGLYGALQSVGAMFGAGGVPFWSGEAGYYLSSYGAVLVLAAICSTPVVKTLFEKLSMRKGARAISAMIKPCVTMAILVLATAYFADSSFSPFLYFRF